MNEYVNLSMDMVESRRCDMWSGVESRQHSSSESLEVIGIESRAVRYDPIHGRIRVAFWPLAARSAIGAVGAVQKTASSAAINYLDLPTSMAAPCDARMAFSP